MYHISLKTKFRNCFVVDQEKINQWYYLCSGSIFSPTVKIIDAEIFLKIRDKINYLKASKLEGFLCYWENLPQKNDFRITKVFLHMNSFFSITFDVPSFRGDKQRRYRYYLSLIMAVFQACFLMRIKLFFLTFQYLSVRFITLYFGFW